MTGSLNGAKALRKQIERLAEKLNSSEVVPDQGYRRNSSHYPYMCYVNNAFCLFYAKNFDMVPVFIARAASHSEKYQGSNIFIPHRDVSAELLLQLTKYIDLYTEASLSHIQQFAESFYLEYIRTKRDA